MGFLVHSSSRSWKINPTPYHIHEKEVAANMKTRVERRLWKTENPEDSPRKIKWERRFSTVDRHWLYKYKDKWERTYAEWMVVVGVLNIRYMCWDFFIKRINIIWEAQSGTLCVSWNGTRFMVWLVGESYPTC